ncbi:MAG: tagatose-6-phosphate ketose isomerase [Acidobacteriota bacterium]
MDAIAGTITRAEILEQPALWRTTLERVREFDLRESDEPLPVVITGAGTSAHAATAIAAAWPGARAIATTDLLIDHDTGFSKGGLLLSIARSGDSPESVAVVRRIQERHPEVRHLAITCNPDGRLAHSPGVEVLQLDPRTNDRGLAMTSSFSNLALAGLALKHLSQLSSALPKIASDAQSAITEFDEQAGRIAALKCSRAVILASGSLTGAAREASLKILELTAGQVPTLTETFLGLRHGPMSFLRADTLVLCFLSSDPRVRRFEEDVIKELHSKSLGRVVAITPSGLEVVAPERQIRALATDLPDKLRTPFEIVFAQLLAWHMSLQAGLDPDNPSPKGVINRVVQGFQLFED